MHRSSTLALTRSRGHLPEAVLDSHFYSGAELLSVVQSIVLARKGVPKNGWLMYQA